RTPRFLRMPAGAQRGIGAAGPVRYPAPLTTRQRQLLAEPDLVQPHAVRQRVPHPRLPDPLTLDLETGKRPLRRGQPGLVPAVRRRLPAPLRQGLGEAPVHASPLTGTKPMNRQMLMADRKSVV